MLLPDLNLLIHFTTHFSIIKFTSHLNATHNHRHRPYIDTSLSENGFQSSLCCNFLSKPPLLHALEGFLCVWHPSATDSNVNIARNQHTSLNTIYQTNSEQTSHHDWSFLIHFCTLAFYHLTQKNSRQSSIPLESRYILLHTRTHRHGFHSGVKITQTQHSSYRMPFFDAFTYPLVHWFLI